MKRNYKIYYIFSDFLVKQLEIKACKLNVSNNGIISGFLQLGVSMEDLLDIYK